MKIEVEIAADRIVIAELKDYYNLCKQPGWIDCSSDVIDPDVAILKAIEVVLRDYLTKNDYDAWYKEHGYHG